MIDLKRPSKQNWIIQDRIWKSLTDRFFLHLQQDVTNREPLNFVELHSDLDSWYQFIEEQEHGENQDGEFHRLDIMHSLVWCAEQAYKDSIPYCNEAKRLPTFLKNHEAWGYNCISILRGEDDVKNSVLIPIAVSSRWNEDGVVLALVLELLQHGDGHIFHHPIDFLATYPSKSFENSMDTAWSAARSLLQEEQVDVMHNGRWRLLTMDNYASCAEIDGLSASGSAALGWCLAFQNREPDPCAIVLAEIGSSGKLSPVGGIRGKIRSVITNPRLNTVIVNDANEREAIATLRECDNTSIKLVAMDAYTSTLHYLVDLFSVSSLHYDFSSSDLREWTEAGTRGDWQIEGSELSGECQVYPSSELIFGSEEWDDYVLECRVKIMDTFVEFPNCMTWVGVTARYQNTYNNYVFAIDEAKQCIDADIEMEGKPKVFRLPFVAEKNKYYRLKVSVKGNHFQFFVDNNLIHDFNDDSVSTGKVGVMLIRAHAHFDGFVVTGKRICAN